MAGMADGIPGVGDILGGTGAGVGVAAAGVSVGDGAGALDGEPGVHSGHGLLTTTTRGPTIRGYTRMIHRRRMCWTRIRPESRGLMRRSYLG